MPARAISRLVIHCSASPNGDSLFRSTPVTLTPVQVVDDWHRVRGFHRAPEARQRFNGSLSSIGYHYLLYVNGAVATGRHEDEIGAHVEGYNKASIGVCLIGTDRFSVAQWSALAHLVADLRRRYPGAAVLGHRDFPGVAKRCPGFDAPGWYERGMISDPDHTL